MRAKRSKQYRKLMQQYCMNFGHRTPYQVLIDAQLIMDCAASKLNLGKLLESTLHGEIKPMITQCCIRHLYHYEATSDAEEREKDAWIEVAKAAERRRCGHHELDEPLSTLECLVSIVDPKGSGRNRHNYVVASQDQEVRARMRAVAGVPLVYMKRSVMILEPMAGATEEAREQDERQKVRAGLKGRRQTNTGVKRKREDDDEGAASGTEHAAGEEAPTPKRKKPRGPKGPNPLSVKKSKTEKSKKPIARQVEDERATVRKASKRDPQAAEKALDSSIAVDAATGTGTDGITEGVRKRKRKRKPQDKDDIEAVGAGVVDE
ncbi:hypothetical protein LTR37_010995 [Vermiconidia calcicola]|uniref:Uncharacterized protein n=1 Tax=Vermiconidia calcicola TaxID=1690605 RepID=A0ACC3N399_9PEZI|nr:hypothetical protein LTR37_010995 [Vermiconidia calcicola]